jgi:tetratricopeptide (TPR) repeat protein
MHTQMNYPKISFPAMLAVSIMISFCVATSSQGAIDPRDGAQLQACITKIDADPAEAYEDGLVWRNQSGGLQAEQCIALAKIALGDVEAGARRLAALARATDIGDTDQRALLLAKAANAWLMIGAFEQALDATTAALAQKPEEVDLLIDRARAFAGLENWAKAQEDLTLALSKRPSDALIFRLRAEAFLQQRNYDGAQQDVSQALRLAPGDVAGYVMRGRVSEARRLGRPPEF